MTSSLSSPPGERESSEVRLRGASSGGIRGRFEGVVFVRGGGDDLRGGGESKGSTENKTYN